MCVMTLLFESYESELRYLMVYQREKNGERGYMLTFVIAYIRYKKKLQNGGVILCRHVVEALCGMQQNWCKC
ncbi:hypothetical protein NQ318_007676 [Aromia moschata]|uniref:Uncharacterized protein n=1 Tax=Aromia moschata TaxID=1265417 RepID=A0AAV8XJM9_9CUCU|nr:hypothetical protein NQ318_007676 [Aromia moschata]